MSLSDIGWIIRFIRDTGSGLSQIIAHAGEEETGMATIVVVDDEPDILDLLQMLLEDLGYTTLIAGNGEEALNVCSAYPERIHILITDILMPEMNGHTLAARLKASRPRLKVIYMSGEPRQSLIDQGRLPPDATIMSKPFNLIEVETIIHEVMASPP